jgi:catechol-2,3-dioxygenase
MCIMTEKRPPFTIGGLGEVAIRCHDMAAMTAFYRDVIGLTPYATRNTGKIQFFRVGQGGVAGHTTVLALFADDLPATGQGSSLHHLALSLPYAEQEAAIAWYDQIGQAYRIEHFDWTGWRGVFTSDPEGNTVELVAATGAHHP